MTDPPPAPATLGPVQQRERIVALDAVRGLALLGIFLVNIQTFTDAIGHMFTPDPEEGASGLDLFVHYAVKVFCEGKFYPLFSMLFGMGLALQFGRAERAGRSFVGFYWRRLVTLALFGAVHIVFIWYGDILLIYSAAGAVLMLAARARARTMVITAIVLISLALFLQLALGTIGILSEQAWGAPEPDVVATAEAEVEAEMPIAAAVESEADDPTTGADQKTGVARLLDEISISQPLDPTGDLWIQAETEVFRDGPYAEATLFRVFMYAMMMLLWQVLAGGFLHVVGMFFLGAALMKARIFERTDWLRRFAWLGLFVGLPAGLFYAFGTRIAGETAGLLLAPVVNTLGGPFMSLGYLSVVALLVASFPQGWFGRALANVGRMALTNYLMQSVIAGAVMYHWGMGRFGTFSRFEGALLVLTVYAGQIVFSAFWFQAFRIGPMEWLWRTATYLRPQPLLKQASEG